ncbi:hypothetical protein KOI35_42305 [Actinoplanes bogorensis]|uniref:Ribosomal protein L7/L12 C-terminal domain-containing protein n=1 Tax=Paractinoplanes bogorensis TaxID=1610840 RepID=A0ABS5Z6Q2_9ACTN|nr:hypothetical protein [Actinoplanes bogorensis]MBU2670155.1 hypothetical protein [Actinoplanes bogorensis]
MDFGSVVAIIIAGVGVALVFASGRSDKSARETARMAAIERKLDAVMAHLGIEEPVPDHDPELLAHLDKGEKIQAIKIYRDRTGASLADAKNAVEQIARDRRLD